MPLVVDDVREVYGQSQNVKTRQELYARNLANRGPTLHEAIGKRLILSSLLHLVVILGFLLEEVDFSILELEEGSLG